MGNDKEILLVHASMERVSLQESVNVMLTPQFYTLKKEAIPVKYQYQAKRIAPSLFDGLLEDWSSYEYMVFKEDESWTFIAYNTGQISSLLLSKGIKLEQVSKIFFAEQVRDKFTDPVLLGDKEALVVLNNTVVVVPQAVLQEETLPLTFDTSFTPKKGIAIQGSQGSFLTLKQASILAVIFSFLAIIFFVEGWRHGNNFQAGKAEMQELLDAYPSLQSKYTRDSIIVKYKTLDVMERKKREIVKTLSRMIFKGVTLTSFDMDEKMFKVQFSCQDAKVAKRIKELAKKNKLNTSSISGSNDLKIEGVL